MRKKDLKRIICIIYIMKKSVLSKMKVKKNIVKTDYLPTVINTDLQNLNLTGYKELGEKFGKKLKLHKMLVSQLIKTKNQKIIPALICSGEELALAYSECKCEKCGVNENLQFHHLIQRNVRGFINDTKYINQRHYWSNICILCNKCHGEFHGFKSDNFLKKSLCISDEKINKVKALYKINNLELNN